MRRTPRASLLGSIGSASGIGAAGWLLLTALGSPAFARAFVEYPGHPATYGDHTIDATWTDGPTTVHLVFDSDESILHGDGNGQSQRTARNTLNHTPPSDPSNPQDYDDLALVAVYGTRLPLLQQMSANGTSTLTYEFGEPIATGFDVFVTDVDTSDDLFVRAFGPGDIALDMTTWSLAAEGDLSLYKNTGTGYSDIVAPPPFVVFAVDAIRVQAVDATNYNRSYSILRAPAGTFVSRFEVEFTGIQNSASRDQGGTGSHIYLGVSTTPETSGLGEDTGTGTGPGFGSDSGSGLVAHPTLRLLSPNPSQGSVRFAVGAARPLAFELSVFDSAGRRLAIFRRSLEVGPDEIEWTPDDTLPAGVYLARLHTPDGDASVSWVRHR
ncbi:MAG: T9SS type A sorting domain-containing protein [Candidatus Eisenbacteria bacterium]